MDDPNAVSLKEHVLALAAKDQRYADLQIEYLAEMGKLRERRDDLARELALTAQKSRDDHANNLIQKMAAEQAHSDARIDKANEDFASKESVASVAAEIKILRDSRADMEGRRAGALDLKALLMLAAGAALAYIASHFGN